MKEENKEKDGYHRWGIKKEFKDYYLKRQVIELEIKQAHGTKDKKLNIFIEQELRGTIHSNNFKKLQFILSDLAPLYSMTLIIKKKNNNKSFNSKETKIKKLVYLIKNVKRLYPIQLQLKSKFNSAVITYTNEIKR